MSKASWALPLPRASTTARPIGAVTTPNVSEALDRCGTVRLGGGSERRSLDQSVRRNRAVRVFDPLPLDYELMTSGEFLLRQFTRSAAWLRRRVDTMTFEDHRTFALRSELHIDFTQIDVGDAKSTWHSIIPLPVYCIERETSGLIELHHIEGPVLPQLTRNEERSLVAAGLTLKLIGDAASSVVDLINSGTTTVDQIYEEVISHLDPTLYGDPTTSIVHQNPPGGPNPVTPASSPGWRHLLGFFQSNRLVILAGTPRRDSGGNGAPSPAPTEELRSLVVIERLQPLSAEQPFQRTVRGASPGQVRVGVRIAGASECESYHLEVRPPSNTFVERLEVTTHTIDANSMAGRPLGYELRWTKASTVSPPLQHAHTYIPHYDNGGEIGPLRPLTYARIFLRPMTIGHMRAGLLASLMTTCTVGFITWLYTWRLTGWPGFGATVSQADINSVVTVIMLGPTLLTAITVRQDEHLMTKRVATSHRFGLTIQVAISLLFAACLAIGIVGSALGIASVAITAISTLVTLSLLRIYLASRGCLRVAASTDLVQLATSV